MLFKSVTLKEATALFLLEDWSKVLRLTSMNVLGMSSSSRNELVIADVLAPVSRSAYEGRLFPLCQINTGTIGLIAPRPPHA